MNGHFIQAKTVKPKAFGIYLDYHKKYIRGFQFWKLVKHCISEKKRKTPWLFPKYEKNTASNIL